ncbi:MAG: hypothetical protein ACRERX_20570, partial [Pseudomonas sp.]
MQSTSLVSLLVITLLATGVLTWLGKRAASDHKQAVATMLRDNAAFAADRLVGLTSNGMIDFTRYVVLSEATLPEGGLENVTFPELVLPKSMTVMCSCNPLDRVTARFAYDFQRDSLIMSEGSLDTDDRARLVHVLKSNTVADFNKHWLRSLTMDESGPGGQVVSFLVRREQVNNPDGTPTRQLALGLLANRGFIRDAVPALKLINERMPRGDPTATRQRFALEMYAGESKVLEEGHKSEYYVEQRFDPGFGGLRVIMYIDGDAVKTMAAVGAVGRNAWLFGLMALVSFLIGASLILARKQSALAADRESFASSVSHELRTPLAQIRM